MNYLFLRLFVVLCVAGTAFGETKNVPARVGPCPPERPPVEARQTRICRASFFRGLPNSLMSAGCATEVIRS